MNTLRTPSMTRKCLPRKVLRIPFSYASDAQARTASMWAEADGIRTRESVGSHRDVVSSKCCIRWRSVLYSGSVSRKFFIARNLVQASSTCSVIVWLTGRIVESVNPFISVILIYKIRACLLDYLFSDTKLREETKQIFTA